MMCSAALAETRHVPVLLQPVLEALSSPFLALPEDAQSHMLVDCTFGGGGHAAAFLEKFRAHEKLRRHRVMAFDRDRDAVARAQERFREAIAEGVLEIRQACFSELPPLLRGKRVLGILADLGFSSDQLEGGARGLSFLKEGPLDMRMDPGRGETCFEFLIRVREEELARVLWEYGEERFSRRIARALVDRRMQGELPRTTKELADLVVRALPRGARHGRIHGATRTFQALRIQVNDEMGQLDSLLRDVIPLLAPGGRAAVISFHSLEDRKVKQAFKDPTLGLLALTKKPVVADEAEREANPRSRSAKLRVAKRG